ncbi:RNA chaperone Hfq [Silvibacterium dinghuense]|uniref:RNA chaperone Hfq n=1 Tax=Silvibacterium dinghuense TaxID=1560006 RepID=A0A4Q1SGJ9_9BACT|nr:RNA chaperone Hfq [Silvibacterium dinghuense]RXS96489.1 hypothetical protein ESZ00_00575 [Silvibacterium dinghuense]GGG91190.1 hypothetical protein GCM10011586_02200 [Silvibacterium dinghuense]
MANPSRFSIGTLHEVRPAMTAVPDDPATEAAALGPRKLVRPRLPEGSARRNTGNRGENTMLTHQAALLGALAGHGHDAEDAHAEAFYFQKQIQTQTLMVFVLEDGEEIEGYIEWFDRSTIKVRNGRKTLIYKSAIKYLYKAGERHPD